MSGSDLRGTAASTSLSAEKMDVPLRVFLWTVDQIAVMLNVRPNQMSAYIYYEGRSTGSRSIHLMIARNISPPGEKAEWRIAENEMKRWLKVKGFRFYEASRLAS